MISEVAKRYAQAVYDSAEEHKKVDEVGSQLIEISKSLSKDEEIRHFVASPVVAASLKAEILKKSIGTQAAAEVQNLIQLLVEKGRIELFSEISAAFEQISDETHGITRGEVRSASPLNEDDRHRLEKTIASVTKKKVILKFTEDKALMGGLVAQVGGWTFDDSLQSHLKRLTEDLHRRTH